MSSRCALDEKPSRVKKLCVTDDQASSRNRICAGDTDEEIRHVMPDESRVVRGGLLY